jgi:hypothetical protein
MELDVFWTEFSQKELENVFDYYKKKQVLLLRKKL